MLALRWEAEAFRKFQDALAYVANRNNPAAERLAREVSRIFEMARRFSALGRPGRVAESHELVTHPNYLLVYAVRTNSIDVIRFLHARQFYP